MSPKILIGPSSFGENGDAAVRLLREEGYEPIANPYGRKLTKAELQELLSDEVVGIIAGLEPLDREVLCRSRLRAISRCGSGLSNVDLKAAAELRIAVRSTPAAPVDSVAELTIAAMLCLLRNVALMDREMRQGRWIKRTGRLLKGRTIAIVGFGRIGRRLASLLRPFDARLLAVDPLFNGHEDGIELMSLRQALPLADIVTLHCSGEEVLLGPCEFEILKEGCILLNAARGSLIHEPSLLKALDSKRVAGAWLDTFPNEPYQGPLGLRLEVLLTPHVGSYTSECRRLMELEAVENLINALKEA